MSDVETARMSWVRCSGDEETFLFSCFEKSKTHTPSQVLSFSIFNLSDSASEGKLALLKRKNVVMVGLAA